MGPAESRQKAFHHEGDSNYRVEDACSIVFSVRSFAHSRMRAKSDRLVSFGSIYFASDEVESAVPALLTSEASPELKNQVNKKFSIGPTVDRGFWNKERSSMQISRGPCKHFHAALCDSFANSFKGERLKNMRCVLAGVN